MQRSVGRLSGIATVFSRGFRSSAFVTMPIKVGVIYFLQFVVELIFIARSATLVPDNVLVFQSFVFPLKLRPHVNLSCTAGK